MRSAASTAARRPCAPPVILLPRSTQAETHLDRHHVPDLRLPHPEPAGRDDLGIRCERDIHPRVVLLVAAAAVVVVEGGVGCCERKGGRVRRRGESSVNPRNTGANRACALRAGVLRWCAPSPPEGWAPAGAAAGVAAAAAVVPLASSAGAGAACADDATLVSPFPVDMADSDSHSRILRSARSLSKGFAKCLGDGGLGPTPRTGSRSGFFTPPGFRSGRGRGSERARGGGLPPSASRLTQGAGFTGDGDSGTFLVCTFCFLPSGPLPSPCPEIQDSRRAMQSVTQHVTDCIACDR